MAALEAAERPPVFTYWADQKMIQRAVPEIRAIETRDIDAYFPIKPKEGVDILAAFTTADALPNRQTEADDDAGADDESEAQTPYAVVLRGELSEDEAKAAADATLLARSGDDTLFVFGGNEMRQAALKVLAFATKNAQSEKNYLLLRPDGSGKWLTLTDEALESDWWLGVTDMTDDANALSARKQAAGLSTRLDPVYCIESEAYKLFVYDYTDDPANARVLSEDVFPQNSWITQNYVIIWLRNTAE